MNSISTITPTLGNCVVKLDTEERVMALDSGITLFGTVVRMGDHWPEYEQGFGEGDRVKLMHSNDQKFEEEDGTYIVTPFSNIQGYWGSMATLTKRLRRYLAEKNVVMGHIVSYSSVDGGKILLENCPEVTTLKQVFNFAVEMKAINIGISFYGNTKGDNTFKGTHCFDCY